MHWIYVAYADIMQHTVDPFWEYPNFNLSMIGFSPCALLVIRISWVVAPWLLAGIVVDDAGNISNFKYFGTAA